MNKKNLPDVHAYVSSLSMDILPYNFLLYYCTIVDHRIWLIILGKYALISTGNIQYLYAPTGLEKYLHRYSVSTQVWKKWFMS